MLQDVPVSTMPAPSLTAAAAGPDAAIVDTWVTKAAVVAGSIALLTAPVAGAVAATAVFTGFAGAPALALAAATAGAGAAGSCELALPLTFTSTPCPALAHGA